MRGRNFHVVGGRLLPVLLLTPLNCSAAPWWPQDTLTLKFRRLSGLQDQMWQAADLHKPSLGPGPNRKQPTLVLGHVWLGRLPQNSRSNQTWSQCSRKQPFFFFNRVKNPTATSEEELHPVVRCDRECQLMSHLSAALTGESPRERRRAPANHPPAPPPGFMFVFRLLAFKCFMSSHAGTWALWADYITPAELTWLPRRQDK